jgi:PPM family protein phosphatase
MNCWLINKTATFSSRSDLKRVYRLRKTKLEQLTSDHTFVQEMIEEGDLTPESAANDPLRNMLTRVLGTHQPLEKIDTGIVDAAPGDRFLLCPDGLHNMMSIRSGILWA